MRIRSANRWVIGSTHHGAVSIRPSAAANSPTWKRLRGEPPAGSEITGLESSFASAAGRWRRSSLCREKMALLLARRLPAGGALPVAGRTASEDVALLLRAAILPADPAHAYDPPDDAVRDRATAWLGLSGRRELRLARWQRREQPEKRAQNSNPGSLGQGPDKHSVAANLEPTRRSIIPVQ